MWVKCPEFYSTKTWLKSTGWLNMIKTNKDMFVGWLDDSLVGLEVCWLLSLQYFFFLQGYSTLTCSMGDDGRPGWNRALPSCQGSIHYAYILDERIYAHIQTIKLVYFNNLLLCVWLHSLPLCVCKRVCSVISSLWKSLYWIRRDCFISKLPQKLHLWTHMCLLHICT